MSIPLPFANNTIPVFSYEGFSFTISNPGGLTLQPVIPSAGLNATNYFTQDGNVSYTFAITNVLNNLTPGSTENFVLSGIDASGVLIRSSNVVSINPGRFVDQSGNSFIGNSYTFFKNEPITPIRLVGPFPLRQPISIPTLPPGLSFTLVSSNIYDIRGTPSVVVPNSNYQIIGVQSGGSKVVTTRFNMAISNERVGLNIVGDPRIDNMSIGIPISPRVFTSIPPIGSSVLRYTFPTLPDGIVATDSTGVPQISPFFPTDPSFTMIVSGTPTVTAANFFRDAGVTSNGLVYTVQASRTVPSPLVVNSTDLVFAFGQTVLFDTPTLSPLFTGVQVSSGSTFFRAQSYFGPAGIPITSIFSPDLRSDLSLVFIPSLSRADLSGTPSFTGSNTFTFRATDASGISRDILAPIVVSADTVSFSSPIGNDLCYNFIVSRPVNSSMPGFYPSDIRFVATSTSGRPVTLSAPALSSTGLSLVNGVITGVPDRVTPLTDLVVTASSVGSPATATKTVRFSILDDVFTFDPSINSGNFQFVENIPLIPFQVPVTTLSGRNIVNYSQSGLPQGITVNSAGVISGTPLSSITGGNISVIASTGFASGLRDFSFNLVPDSILFVVNPTQYFYKAGDPVGTIPIKGLAFSGTTVSNYDLSLSPTYGLTLGQMSGLLSGTWTNGIPPNDQLPASCNFTIKADAGRLTGELPASITATSIVLKALLVGVYGNYSQFSIGSTIMYIENLNDSSGNVMLKNISNTFSPESVSDILVKKVDLSASTIVAVIGNNTLYGTSLQDISSRIIGEVGSSNAVSQVIHKPGTKKWWLGGRGQLSNSGSIGTVLIPSIESSDGELWDDSAAVFIANSAGQELLMRDNDTITTYNNVYLRSGLALEYGQSIIMAGGISTESNGSGGRPIMLRSSNEGSTWTNVIGGFTRETANFNMDVSSMWIATGSDLLRSVDFTPISFNPNSIEGNTTIRYSTDAGQNWTAASGGFNAFGYEVAYGNNAWIATGVSKIGTTFTPEIRYSTNGSNWSNILLDLSDAPILVPKSNIMTAPLRLGSLSFDGDFWNVFVNAQGPEVSGGDSFSMPRLFRHDTQSALSGGWTSSEIVGDIMPDINVDLRFLSARSAFVYLNRPPITIQLDFNTADTLGPTITSPSSTSFLQFQYIPISPIQLSATGVGQVYFFIESADLPPGLTFNQLTNQITGKIVRIGNDTVQVFARDSMGTSIITLSFTTIIPRIIRKQDGAGSYTSLLRQYTEVLGAQNGRDNRALPTQERRLGEFMSPEAPDVITQVIDPKCRNPNC